MDVISCTNNDGRRRRTWLGGPVGEGAEESIETPDCQDKYLITRYSRLERKKLKENKDLLEYL